MGGEGDLLSRVRAVAALLDDAALAALANPGLVKRARKDAERSPPVVVGEAEGRLRLTVEGQTVDLTDRPAEGRCSCPAGGRCRHVLAALVHLGIAAASPETEPAARCGGELLGLAEETLRRWCGAAALRRAAVEVAAGLEVTFEDGAPWLARLIGWNAECRLYPGGGLEGMICSCHAAGACAHKVAAVVAWQARGGIRTALAEQAVLAQAAGAPRTRQEVRGSARQVLADLVVLGFSRASPAVEARMRTLATSAHGVDLPQLERLLRGVGDEVGAWLRREARASSATLLARAAQTYALAEALERPLPALVGRHRARFDPVGDLELLGMGARAWRSGSGYAGLTVYFWERQAAQWATWSEARPLGTPGFDPVQRYTAPGPWSGCPSPAAAASGRIKLLGAFRSAGGRLSGRESTRMLALGPLEPGAVPAVTRWSELVPKAWKAFGGGLGERDERAAIALLAPSTWREPHFDSARQVLEVTVADADGRELPLVLPFLAPSHASVDEFEEGVRRSPAAVLVSLRFFEGRLVAEPVALVEGHRVTSLGLVGSTPGARAPVAAEGSDADEDSSVVDEADPALTDGPLAKILGEARGELERIAEGGIGAWRRLGELRALVGRAEQAGFASVARALAAITEAGSGGAGASERERLVATAALRAAHIVHACEVAFALEVATGEESSKG